MTDEAIQPPVTRRGYSPKEVAAMTGVHVKLIYEEINKGTIKAVSLGSRKIVPAAEVDRLFPSRAAA